MLRATGGRRRRIFLVVRRRGGRSLRGVVTRLGVGSGVRASRQRQGRNGKSREEITHKVSEAAVVGWFFGLE